MALNNVYIIYTILTKIQKNVHVTVAIIIQYLYIIRHEWLSVVAKRCARPMFRATWLIARGPLSNRQ